MNLKMSKEYYSEVQEKTKGKENCTVMQKQR